MEVGGRGVGRGVGGVGGGGEVGVGDKWSHISPGLLDRLSATVEERG